MKTFKQITLQRKDKLMKFLKEIQFTKCDSCNVEEYALHTCNLCGGDFCANHILYLLTSDRLHQVKFCFTCYEFLSNDKDLNHLPLFLNDDFIKLLIKDFLERNLTPDNLPF